MGGAMGLREGGGLGEGVCFAEKRRKAIREERRGCILFFSFSLYY